jgi:hypothetical protein
MPQLATFLDTTLPEYSNASRALTVDGWKKVHNTKGNRRNILLKYYEYLVNTNAKLAGLNVGKLTPTQLEPVWTKANAEYEKYEMYIKDNGIVVNDDNTEMNGTNTLSAPTLVVESFASVNDVERMQPGYVDIDDLLSGFGQMGFSGGKRRKHRKQHTKKTHKRKYTRRH